MDSDTTACDNGGRIIFAPPPGSVTASDGEYTDHVEIRWVDISSINTGYTILRESSPIGTTGPNTTFYRDSTATAEVVYPYDVIATVTGGYESAPEGDTGWMGIILPPINVEASDGQYLDWVRITWDGQAPDTLWGYYIYRNDELIDSTDANVTTYDDTGAVLGETYTYCVATKGSGVMRGEKDPGFEELAKTRRVGAESVKICDEGGRSLDAPGAVMRERFDLR